MVWCPQASGRSGARDSVEPGNASATLTFTPADPTGSSAVTGWQVSTDDDGTWNALSTGTGPITGTVSGLTNGTTYDVKVRATSASGTGAASTAVAVTPYAPLPAPAGVTATVGVSSIEVDWNAVGGATGYEAWALPGADPQSSQGLVTCETTTGLSCLLAVTPGSVYSVYARALDAHLGEASTQIVTGVLPGAEVPTSVPTGSAPLTTNDSTLTGGQQVTLTGSGYLPGSTVTVIMYSTPTVLGTIVVDGAGNFTYTVTIPAGLEAGTHSLVASGVDSSGATRFLRVDVTVTSAGTVSGLAFTGFSILGPLLAGLGALGAGTGLLVASRRRPVAILA